jgi:hypothetical protein
MFALGADGGDPKARKRTFSGVGYSGDVIPNHWYWGNVIFDLTTMSVPDKLPALIDHNRSCRAGYVTEHSVDASTGFAVKGVLLSNESGQAVAADSDDGFPWQMSVHINPGSIEEVKAGTSVTVNGKVHEGPITVFRNSTLSEVSFTATGWDANTSAAAMSRGGAQPTPPDSEGNDMDLAQLQQQVATLTATNATLQASVTALTADKAKLTEDLAAFSKAKRDGDIKQLFSDLGREAPKADDAEVKAFSVMTQEGFDVTAKMLRDQFSKTQTAQSQASVNLFGHTANGGGSSPANADPAAMANAANPLLANAKARGEQFSKRSA